MKACKSILTSLIIEKKVDPLHPVITAFVELLPALLAQQSVDLLLLALSCLGDLANAHHLGDADLRQSFDFALAVSKNDAVPAVIRSAAANFLVNAVEAYSEAFLREGLVGALVECSVQHLAEGVDSRGEEADEAVCDAFEMLLDAVGCFLPER